MGKTLNDELNEMIVSITAIMITHGGYLSIKTIKKVKNAHKLLLEIKEDING